MAANTNQTSFIIDSCGKKRKAENCFCDQCGISFLKDARESKRSLKNFCTNDCRKKFSERNTKIVKCSHCGCETKKSASRICKSKSGLFFCSRKCKDDGQKISNGLREVWPSHYGQTKDYQKIAFREKDHKCERCGIKERHLLCVHHKDRNRDNNSLENLEILCWNCHATEHYNAGDGWFWSSNQNK